MVIVVVAHQAISEHYLDNILNYHLQVILIIVTQIMFKLVVHDHIGHLL